MIPRELPPFRQSIAGRLLAAREAVMEPVRPILRDADVTEQQWRVLRALIDGGAVDVSTLASAALLRPPSLTRILKDLKARGLIERAADPLDARRSIIGISSAGRALVDATTAATLERLDRYADAFGVERLRALIRELGLFVEAVVEPGDLSAID